MSLEVTSARREASGTSHWGAEDSPGTRPFSVLQGANKGWNSF